MGANDHDWKWYSGDNDEAFCGGPFDTREQAIAALDGYGGYVIEAQKTDLRLSDMFDAEEFLEAAEERAYDLCNEDGDPIFDVSEDQEKDLRARVRATIDAWQDDHGLKFVPWRFTDQRNLERVESDSPGGVTHETCGTTSD